MPEQLSLHAADAEDIRRRQGAEFHEPEMIIPLDGTLCLKQNASLQTHDPWPGVDITTFCLSVFPAFRVPACAQNCCNDHVFIVFINCVM